MLVLVLYALKPGETNQDNKAEAKKIYSYDLKLLEPKSTSTMQIGQTLKVGLEAGETKSGPGPTTAEVVIDYNPQILELKQIMPTAEALSLNNKIDNSSGRGTIDLATTSQQGFTPLTNLVELEFIVKKVDTKTKIKLAKESTYGSPNQLNRTKSHTNLSLNISSQ